MPGLSYMWNKPTILPTVGAPLRLKMACGRVVEGMRPSYVHSATGDDPGYVNRSGKLISVQSIEGWAYQAWSG